MPLSSDLRRRYGVGLGASLLLVLLAAHPASPVEVSLLEAVAVVTSAWGVWLLAENRPLGWWIGLVGVAAYAVVFYRARLYAEVGIQIFYFITGIQAIYLWLRGGEGKTEKPIGRAPGRWLLLSAALGIAATLGLQAGLVALRGAAPFWDALTTVLSLIAQLYLVARYVESWHLWIAVDVIYVPLYASRGLYATSLLYAAFLLMAVKGLRTFLHLYRAQQARVHPDAWQPS